MSTERIEDEIKETFCGIQIEKIFDSLGFKHTEEKTTDCVRWVFYSKEINNDVTVDDDLIEQGFKPETFHLIVEYELSIGDDWRCESHENFSYSFNRVFFCVLSSRVPTPPVPPLSSLCSDDVTFFRELRITKFSEIRQLMSHLGA